MKKYEKELKDLFSKIASNEEIASFLDNREDLRMIQVKRNATELLEISEKTGRPAPFSMIKKLDTDHYVAYQDGDNYKFYFMEKLVSIPKEYIFDYTEIVVKVLNFYINLLIENKIRIKESPDIAKTMNSIFNDAITDLEAFISSTFSEEEVKFYNSLKKINQRIRSNYNYEVQKAFRQRLYDDNKDVVNEKQHEVIYSKAYQDSHSGGYSEIFYTYEELIDLYTKIEEHR